MQKLAVISELLLCAIFDTWFPLVHDGRESPLYLIAGVAVDYLWD